MSLPPLNSTFTNVTSGSPYPIPEDYHYLPIPTDLNRNLVAEYLYINNTPAIICLRMGSSQYYWTGYVLKDVGLKPKKYTEAYAKIVDYAACLDPYIHIDSIGSHTHGNIGQDNPREIAPYLVDEHNFFPPNLIFVYGTSFNTGVSIYDVDDPYLAESKVIIIKQVNEMDKILTMLNITN